MRYTGDMSENKVFTEDDFETRYGSKLTVYQSPDDATPILIVEKRDHLPAKLILCKEGRFRADIDHKFSGWSVRIGPHSDQKRIEVDANHNDFLMHLAMRLMMYGFPAMITMMFFNNDTNTTV